MNEQLLKPVTAYGFWHIYCGSGQVLFIDSEENGYSISQEAYDKRTPDGVPASLCTPFPALAITDGYWYKDLLASKRKEDV